MTERGHAALRAFLARFSVRRKAEPIDSVDGLCGFVATRAAFVSQDKLYGYLKARMGARYTSVFADETFIESVGIARMHVYAASLSDLTVFCVAGAAAGRLGPDEAAGFARECYRRGLEANAGHVGDRADVEAWSAAFEGRLEAMRGGEADAGMFDASQEALLRWAPVAPDLKRLDAEIITNSIRFAWTGVRIDFRRRLDAEAVRADWRAAAREP